MEIQLKILLNVQPLGMGKVGLGNGSSTSDLVGIGERGALEPGAKDIVPQGRLSQENTGSELHDHF